MTKVIITSDYHAQYLDQKAFKKMLNYTKKYKPDIFIINGDLVDFYSISHFDKNPNRKTSIYDEILIAKDILKKIRKTVSKKCKIIWLKGNHENRLNSYLRIHNELISLPFFGFERLFNLDEYNVEFIGASMDYDKDPSELGYLKIADMIITHGDNRLNGTSTSKYSGYSASNSIRNLMTNLVIGHSHRAGIIFHTTPDKTYIGIECGCLCKIMGSANWQQAFVTFEYKNDKSFNHKIIRIDDL